MPVRPPRYRPAGQSTHGLSARQAYDNRRGSSRSRGYTAEWDKARAAFLARPENCLCLGCRAVGLVVPSTVVDHVEPHRGDMDVFWRVEMWQACCHWHHVAIKQQLETMRDRGQIGVAGLWLNSPEAVRLTRLAMPSRGPME